MAKVLTSPNKGFRNCSSMIAKLCLLFNTVACLAYSVMLAFEPEKLLAGVGLPMSIQEMQKDALWPVLVGAFRYLSACLFTFAFLMG